LIPIPPAFWNCCWTLLNFCHMWQPKYVVDVHGNHIPQWSPLPRWRADISGPSWLNQCFCQTPAAIVLNGKRTTPISALESDQFSSNFFWVRKSRKIRQKCRKISMWLGASLDHSTTAHNLSATLAVWSSCH
jgi:hypothetical protein